MHHVTHLLSAFVLLVSSAMLCTLPATRAQEASPVAIEAIRESIVTTTVAPEDLPDGPRLKVELWHATLEPEVEITMPAGLFTTGPGVLIEHVVAGELTLRVEGPLQIVRARSGGTPGSEETVTPGTEVILQPGDSALFAQRLARTYANHGAESVRLIGGQLATIEGTPGAIPVGYTVNTIGERDLTEDVDPGPMTFALERVALAPGAVLPAPPAGALRVLTSGPSVVYLAGGADGSVSNVLKEPVEAYALTLLPEGSVAGSPKATPNATG